MYLEFSDSVSVVLSSHQNYWRTRSVLWKSERGGGPPGIGNFSELSRWFPGRLRWRTTFLCTGLHGQDSTLPTQVCRAAISLASLFNFNISIPRSWSCVLSPAPTSWGLRTPVFSKNYCFVPLSVNGHLPTSRGTDEGICSKSTCTVSRERLGTSFCNWKKLVPLAAPSISQLNLLLSSQFL